VGNGGGFFYPLQGGHLQDVALNQYFKDLAHLKPLSRKDETELAEQISRGSMRARDKLVLANLRFVVTVAREYENRGLSLADLISSGNLGLVTAVERFDGTRGFKFISYAVWWIRQAIRQSLAQDVRTIRIPVNRTALLARIYKTDQASQQMDEHSPPAESLAETLGVSREMVRETLELGRKVRSLDAPVSEGEDYGLLQFLPDRNQQPQDEKIAEDSARKVIRQVLDTIDLRESEVLRLYFGIDQEAPMTLEQIGRRYNLTRERIRQIKEKALTKLQHPTRRGKLHTILRDTEFSGSESVQEDR